LEPRPEWLITKRLGVEPRQMWTPIWDRFLNEFTKGDRALLLFVYRWLGYCLTGIMREQVFVFIWGQGGSGKGTLFDTVKKIMGDYADTAPMETFTASKGGYDRHPVEREDLRGPRLVTASETQEGRVWNEQLIKEVTGQDPIKARGMRENFSSFVPVCKLMFSGNHKPKLLSVGWEIRRRLLVIEANTRPRKIDQELREHLEDELPGIAWKILRGCLKWQKQGLRPPQAIAEASEEYFQTQDLRTQWAEAWIEPTPTGLPGFTRRTAFWKSWESFAKGLNENAGTRQAFRDWMETRFGKHELLRGHQGWRTIRIRKITSDEGEETLV
jgi:putative DNA primase/helicase